MKSIYRVISSEGRVYIPKAVRESAGLGAGDVLEITAGKGRITLARARVVPSGPPDVDDILDLLASVPKAKLFEATAKLMSDSDGVGVM